MALRLVMRWLYFSILALHTKYEPCKPSRTLSNRLLNDKTASNGLKNSLKIMFEASTDLNFFSQFWPQKHAHKNRGVKRASHVKFELNLCPGTPSNRLLKDKTASNGLTNSLKVTFEAHFKLCMKIWHIFYCISIFNGPGLDIEWFNLTLKVKSEISQTFCGP